MKNLIRLTEYTENDIYNIFKLTDEVQQGKYSDILKGKSVVLFFPNSSIRTRKGNIGLAWKEASEVMGFDLEQCCGKGYEMENIVSYSNIKEAISGKDIVCTDSLPASVLDDFKNCQVTKEMMKLANEGAILNPCPPFYRGEEVSDDVIESEYFVGYEFKKVLLEVQQAIIIYCLT